MNFIKKMTLTLIGATIIATNGIAQSVQHTTQGITSVSYTHLTLPTNSLV